MRCIAVSQQVIVDQERGTRSDALDQRWRAFLRHCDLQPAPLPNDVTVALDTMARLPVSGILLTGGNDLCAYGGTTPERDATELAILDEALRGGLPVLGVCRGMQVLQYRFGIPLTRVAGQVTPAQLLEIDGRERVVNSYHNWAARQSRFPLRTWVTGPGQVIKAVRHESVSLVGIMWHPERMTPFADEDRELFRDCFRAAP